MHIQKQYLYIHEYREQLTIVANADLAYIFLLATLLRKYFVAITMIYITLTLVYQMASHQKIIW